VGKTSRKTVVIPIRFEKQDDPTGAGDNVPNFHTGTARVLPFVVAHRGLLPDEVPAILQTNESVLNRRATAALGTHAIGSLNAGGRAFDNSGVESRLDKLNNELQQQRREHNADRQFMNNTLPKAIGAAIKKAVA